MLRFTFARLCDSLADTAIHVREVVRFAGRYDDSDLIDVGLDGVAGAYLVRH